jgi:hypothetical protein
MGAVGKLHSSDGTRFYTAEMAARLAGITYRQLDWWDRGNLLKPTVEAHGSGSRRRYTWDDVLRLRIAAALNEAGKLREAAHLLPEITSAGPDQMLVGTGWEWSLVPLDAFSVQLLNSCGPHALTVLSVGAFILDLEGRLATMELAPA